MRKANKHGSGRDAALSSLGLLSQARAEASPPNQDLTIRFVLSDLTVKSPLTDP